MKNKNYKRIDSDDAKISWLNPLILKKKVKILI